MTAGKDIGIEAARLDAPEHADLIESMKGQLLIAFLRRLLVGGYGGELRVPVAEIDATGQWNLSFRVDGRDFVFTLEKKH